MTTTFPNPYKALYENPKGAGDARPTALKIIKDNDLVSKWPGKVCLVTGATSSIGLESVRALRSTGADVYFTARDVNKGKAAVESVLRTHNQGGELDYIIMEGQNLQSVRNAAKEFLRRSDKLHILINNAGKRSRIMATPYGLTEDGIEQQFGVNHLAHFLLINRLLPALQKSATPGLSSRVVQVSSSGHRPASVDFQVPRFTPDQSSYNPGAAYAQSKTAMIWTANYIDRVYGPKGVHAHSLHPGGIWSNLQQHLDPNALSGWKADPAVAQGMYTPEQGAATQIWAAVAKDLEGLGGRYLVECREAEPSKQKPPYEARDNGFAPHIYDPEKEDKLWAESLKLAETEG